MKSKRMMAFLLVGIIIVVLVAAGLLYSAYAREATHQDELNDAIARNQAVLTRQTTEKNAKIAEAAELKQQLAEAQLTLDLVGFRDSAESIEYDRILFSISQDTRLQVTSLTATAPLDLKEGDTTYHITTFTISVEGITPSGIISTSGESASYIAGVVNNVLAYVDTLANSPDFNTVTIQSVNISAPEPMTDDEVAEMIEAIKDQIESELTDTEKLDKTPAQIETLVQNKFATLSGSDAQRLLELVGLDKPTAVITIKIWTHEGV